MYRWIIISKWYENRYIWYIFRKRWLYKLLWHFKFLIDFICFLSGNIFKVLVNEGDQVEADEVVIIMEAMKMETEIRAVNSGTVTSLHIKEGDSVAVGQALISLG